MEEIFKKLTQLIKGNEKIIFMTHQNMDLDGFASILAFSELVNSFKNLSLIIYNLNPTHYNIKLGFWQIFLGKL